MFFHISLQPLPRLHRSQRTASIQALLLAGNFLYNQKQPSVREGEVANFREFFEKNSIFNEHYSLLLLFKLLIFEKS